MLPGCGLVELRDLDDNTVLGWRCAHCQRFYGAQEIIEAKECVRSCSAQVATP